MLKICLNSFSFKKKTFLEIVKPAIIRPRDGDAETGNVKLKKALLAKKVGKKYRNIYVEQKILDQVRLMNHFCFTEKIKLSLNV